jgi:2-polyprenyl-3-methyl-5-hydroxy-6-metoxy-1,4-benzoquinol methylase
MPQNCPFCFSSNFTSSYLPGTFFNEKHFRYIRCTGCKLIYVDPFPVTDDFIKMYPPSYQSGIDKNILSEPDKKLAGLRFPYNKHFELIKKYSPGKKIIDYGCGTANFLINAKYNGFECDGVEYDPRHVALMQSEIQGSNFFLINDFLEKTDPAYDVIRLSNVLEHLTNPNEIIEKLIKRLNPDGILLIEGPVETNPSLALRFRRLYFILSGLIRKTGSVTHPPTHIFFSNSHNQRSFFSRFSLEEIHFELTECAWPFPEKRSEIHGLADFIKYFIAKLSMALSKISFLKSGNTFIYVGRKKLNSKK